MIGILAAMVLMLALLNVRENRQENAKTEGSFLQELLLALEEEMMELWCPVYTFSKGAPKTGLWEAVSGQFPLFSFVNRQEQLVLLSESESTYEEIIRAEGQDEYSEDLAAQQMRTPEHSEGRISAGAELETLLRRENEAAQGKEADSGGREDAVDGLNGTEGITLAEGAVSKSSAATLQKKESYQWDYFKKFDSLVKEFYIVDASTAVDANQLNLDCLLSKDFSVEKRSDEKPQILIFHTHSQEGFADSVTGDRTTTIEGVGEVLTRILEDQYGYNVLHHLGQYDVEQRDYAYNNSLPALEALLEENPTIEVVIDLHRDEVAEGTKLVTEIDGRPTAMFMFFNGLSRTKKHGNIDYLPNENLADNLAFSFQMQVLCNEYYPGLTRRIYLKGYRYNMHLKARYLLIEMGAQTNTYQECYNACIPLARILDMELSGADFGY